LAREAVLSVDTKNIRETAQNAEVEALFMGSMHGSLAAVEGNFLAARGFVDKTANAADLAGKATEDQSSHASAASA
jgi:hypothetical protein